MSVISNILASIEDIEMRLHSKTILIGFSPADKHIQKHLDQTHYAVEANKIAQAFLFIFDITIHGSRWIEDIFRVLGYSGKNRTERRVYCQQSFRCIRISTLY
jgi:hypothetical protein